MNLELWQIAAAMLQAKIFISDNEEDHTKRTPKRIIQAAQQQREQLRNWAIELSGIARQITK